MNPSVINAGKYDSSEIGPWTRWQGDIGAQLMVIGQDWGGLNSFNRQGGVDIPSPTNDTLAELLHSIDIRVTPPRPGAIRNSCGVYLTNAVLCIKQGGDNGAVVAECFHNCSGFLRRQVELVNPKVVVCLGMDAYRATMREFGLAPERTMLEAVNVHRKIHLFTSGPQIVPVFHCGGLGRRNRSLELQRVDWQRVSAALSA